MFGRRRHRQPPQHVPPMPDAAPPPRPGAPGPPPGAAPAPPPPEPAQHGPQLPPALQFPVDVLTTAVPDDKCGDDFVHCALWRRVTGHNVERVLGEALSALAAVACEHDCVGVYAVQHSVAFSPDGQVHVTVMGTGVNILERNMAPMEGTAGGW